MSMWFALVKMLLTTSINARLTFSKHNDFRILNSFRPLGACKHLFETFCIPGEFDSLFCDFLTSNVLAVLSPRHHVRQDTFKQLSQC